jgi:hypothetical protein
VLVNGQERLTPKPAGGVRGEVTTASSGEQPNFKLQSIYKNEQRAFLWTIDWSITVDEGQRVFADQEPQTQRLDRHLESVFMNIVIEAP